MTYPTSAQILATPVRHRRRVVRVVREWKRRHRGHRRSPEALTDLIAALARVYHRPVRLIFDHHPFGACYSPATHTIHLPDVERGSIVTTLHEFAHHLYGLSERRACRWSVWLYRRVFPRSFAQCTFRGHLLVKR